MRNARKSYLSFIFCIYAPYLLAQAPFMRQIGEKEGLPSQIIYEIKQDQKGFLWLGTDVGIFRYDGYEFKNYVVPQSQGVAFSDFKEDKKGRIFFTNFSGQLFYLYQEQITSIALPRGCRDFGILDYDIDRQSNMWLVSDYLYFSDNLGKTWRRFALNSTMPRGFISKVVVDKYGAAWILADAVYTLVNSEFVRVSPIMTANNLFAFGADVFVTDEKNSLVHQYKAIHKRWQISIGTLQQFTKARIVNLNQDQHQNTWVMTLQGAICFAAQPSAELPQWVFMKDKFVSQILHDREGNYWFATIGDGLFVAPNIDILNFSTDNSSMPSSQINCLAQDETGNLLVGTNSDIAFGFNLKQQVFHQYQLPRGDVECLLYDATRKQLFIESDGVQLFDLKASLPKENYYLGSSSKQFAIFKDQYLIAAAGNGCFVSKISDPKNIKRIDNVFAYNQIAPSFVLRQKRSRAVVADDTKNTFWVAYSDDLYAYKSEGIQKIRINYQTPIIGLSLAIDPQTHQLWVGTAQQGLLLIENDKVTKQYSTKNGLVSNLCKVVKTDGKKIWIGTDKGIQVIDTERNTLKSFNQQDGLISNEIKDLLVQEDKIWVATSKGLTVFEKKITTKNTIPPPIYITKVALAEQERVLSTDYDLSYQENNLYIGFCGLAFKSGGKFTYKYRLKGLNDAWILTESSNNFARYPSLPSGKYIFEVKAINEDGTESLKAATLNISIAYPFWKKWWFSAAILLLVSLLVSAGFYLRIRTIERRNALEMQLKDAYLAALKAQMNPHFLFNVLNSIKGYIYKNDKKNAVLYLNKFADLMRKVLINSEKKQSPLSEELELLTLYINLEAMLLGEEFTWQTNIAEDIDIDEVMLPTLLLQPFVENAFKHGLRHKMGKKSLSLTINNPSKTALVISIDDNGIGRAQSAAINQQYTQKPTSFALKNIQNRISLINESQQQQQISIEIIDKTDTQGKALGTCVVIRINHERT